MKPQEDKLISEEISELKKENARLREFKDYVHKRLDVIGIEKDPESPHKEKGCRIGGRLDIVEKIVDEHSCSYCGWKRRDHTQDGRCYHYSDQDTDYFYDDRFFKPFKTR